MLSYTLTSRSKGFWFAVWSFADYAQTIPISICNTVSIFSLTIYRYGELAKLENNFVVPRKHEQRVCIIEITYFEVGHRKIDVCSTLLRYISTLNGVSHCVKEVSESKLYTDMKYPCYEFRLLLVLGRNAKQSDFSLQLFVKIMSHLRIATSSVTCSVYQTRFPWMLMELDVANLLAKIYAICLILPWSVALFARQISTVKKLYPEAPFASTT